MIDERVGVVMITWQRRDEALTALGRLRGLPEQPHVVLVDNGSTDGTAEAVRLTFPEVEVVALSENLGAVARTVGVRRLSTPYVAFCDDDTWWDPGSLRRAADLLDAYPGIGVLNARIIVEPAGTEDPVVAELRDSPVPAPSWLPGPALGSFLAGAAVVRRDAFLACGGFSARLWLGGEEELLATDLISAGWELCYREDLVIHHQASQVRDARHRRRVGLRNTLWFTWLRRPLGPAVRRTAFLARTVPHDATSALAAWDAMRGLPWLIRQRNPRPPVVEARLAPLDEAQRRSVARRYVG
ncbi:glycosyltransferase family 2 protein [Actinoplanes sp. N902-109]|uniref:glycosyltransferase family 2 protein n=1 Tax=Actinoplanes sp. (strain N902-109) TaxID=649831 RepID=UPI00032955A6|nr:glycosyltransferase [Actinoplanes sp. N902-109]AGL14977.1 family 2 glycosyl transferase [Actinoplanes sp. N902-109]